LLLGRLHNERNRFQECEKRSVLRHLAIQFYDLAERQEKDRRSVDFESVLRDVKAVLPSVGLTATDARPLLTEIVERSGLLLCIDGGERYQFAHLTLQEFFAAEALLNDDRTLLQEFQGDPDAWREVVKLWCGLANDSTVVVRQVREIDPITAFECLADAQKVESVLVDQLLEEFQGKLSESDEVVASFASVASNPHGRGAQVFEFLEETLRSAVSLTPFLWHSNRNIAIRAAWRMARMMKNEKIEHSLRIIPDWEPATRPTALPWLWEPFG